MPRVFIATPWELEGERLQFYDVLSKFSERTSMAKGVLYVPVSLKPVPDKRPFQHAIEDNLQASRHYILVITDDWGPKERSFRKDYHLAIQYAADPDREMRTVTVLAKREPWQQAPELAEGMPKPDAIFSTAAEFEEIVTGLLHNWLAQLPEPEEPPPSQTLPEETPDAPQSPGASGPALDTAPPEPAPAPQPETMSQASESEVCFACGFCCDGTLYPTAAILSHETEQSLVVIGLTPSKGDEGQTVGFALPCPQFNGRCAVYERGRPAVCASYRCRLLRTMAAGNYTTDQAIRIVNEAKALRALLPSETDTMMAAADPQYTGKTAVSHAACLTPLLNDPAAGAFRERYGDTAQPVLRFAEFLNTHFLPGF